MSSCVEFVLLDRNDINGTMDSVCKSSVLKLAAADCTTEVECGCCDLCCADEEDCHDMGLVNTVDWETNYDLDFENKRDLHVARPIHQCLISHSNLFLLRRRSL